MQKVTQKTVEAFLAGESKTVDNTSTDGTTLTLHGNVIARKENGTIVATLAGWPTATTRERLNGLCAALGLRGRFRQCGGEQFFGEQLIFDDEELTLAVIEIPPLEHVADHLR